MLPIVITFAAEPPIAIVFMPVPPVPRFIACAPVPVPMPIVPVCKPVPPIVIVPVVIPAPIFTAPAVCTLAKFKVVAPEPLAIASVFVAEDEPKIMLPL